MAVVNDLHKAAVRAALARLVVQHTHTGAAALAVSEAAHTLGLQIGDLTRESELERYARGVQGQVSNRKWENYAEFRPLVDRICVQASKEWEEILLQ